MSIDLSRRSFMNLLGLAGAVAVARPALSLFGSDEESGILVPDASMTSGHFVVKPKNFLERIPVDERQALDSKYAGSGARVVGRLTRNREPVRPLLVRTGSLSISPRIYFGEETTVYDAHTAFYVASHDMREQFVTFTRETLSQVDRFLLPSATLVTIVDTPIHARPVGLQVSDPTWDLNGTGGISGQNKPDREERGFDVACVFRQFVVVGARRSEISTYEMYSERGEYPVEVPKDVEMGVLIKLDREIVKRGEAQTTRVARLLREFRYS